jgi:hypothetical protein
MHNKSNKEDCSYVATEVLTAATMRGVSSELQRHVIRKKNDLSEENITSTISVVE